MEIKIPMFPGEPIVIAKGIKRVNTKCLDGIQSKIIDLKVKSIW